MMKIILSVLVVLHLFAALWHGDAHSTLGIGLPPLKNLYVYVVIVAGPIVGAILVWTRFALLGIGLVAASMLGALVFGAYHHYVLVSPDNIAHLPTAIAEVHAQFRDSAALIAVVELLSAVLGFFALGHGVAAKSGQGQASIVGSIEIGV